MIGLSSGSVVINLEVDIATPSVDEDGAAGPTVISKDGGTELSMTSSAAVGLNISCVADGIVDVGMTSEDDKIESTVLSREGLLVDSDGAVEVTSNDDTCELTPSRVVLSTMSSNGVVELTPTPNNAAVESGVVGGGR